MAITLIEIRGAWMAMQPAGADKVMVTLRPTECARSDTAITIHGDQPRTITLSDLEELLAAIDNGEGVRAIQGLALFKKRMKKVRGQMDAVRQIRGSNTVPK